MGVIALPAPPGRATVGRATTNDIVLANDSVSSNHALIEVEAYALKITDLQSTNGVAVNRTRMPAGVLLILHNNDVITFGELEFEVRRSS